MNAVGITTKSAAVLKNVRLGALKSKFLNARINDYVEVRSLLNYKGEVSRIKQNMEFEQNLKKDNVSTLIVKKQVQRKLEKEQEEDEYNLQRMISTNLFGGSSVRKPAQVDFVDMLDDSDTASEMKHSQMGRRNTDAPTRQELFDLSPEKKAAMNPLMKKKTMRIPTEGRSSLLNNNFLISNNRQSSSVTQEYRKVEAKRPQENLKKTTKFADT